MSRERRIGSLTVCVECSYAYARAADEVLDTFERMASSGISLKPGVEIRFGWTMFRLVSDRDRLIISEPDFSSWPGEGWSRNIDTSLETLAAQVKLLRRLTVEGEDVFFDQAILAAPGALTQAQVFLRRDSGISAEDSGWLLGSVADPEALDGDAMLERIAIASLVRRRPALLQALALPSGFIVMFSGDDIEHIFDATGVPRI